MNNFFVIETYHSARRATNVEKGMAADEAFDQSARFKMKNVPKINLKNWIWYDKNDNINVVIFMKNESHLNSLIVKFRLLKHSL